MHKYLPELSFHLVCRPQHEWQVMYILTVAENCTSWLVAADDGGVQCFGCCSMAVNAAAVAVAGERREDSAVESHPVVQVVAE